MKLAGRIMQWFCCVLLGLVIGAGWQDCYNRANRKCSNGEPHAYGKWDLQTGTYFSKEHIYQKRTCSNCGWTEWK